MRARGLVDNGVHPRLAGFAAQTAARAFTEHDHAAAKMPGHIQRPRALTGDPNLRNVGTREGARVQVDEGAAVAGDQFEYSPGDDGRQTAIATTGKQPVQVAPVGHVTFATANTRQVDHGQEYDAAPELLRLQGGEYAPGYLHRVDLIPMYARGDTQARARLRTVHHPDGRVDEGGVKIPVLRQREHALAARRHAAVQYLQCAPAGYRPRLLGQRDCRHQARHRDPQNRCQQPREADIRFAGLHRR